MESFEEKPWRKPGGCGCGCVGGGGVLVIGEKKIYKWHISTYLTVSSLFIILTIMLVQTGADLSDYFNYGFNEDTWKAYCEKQKRLRMGLEVSAVSSVTSKITVRNLKLLFLWVLPCPSYDFPSDYTTRENGSGTEIIQWISKHSGLKEITPSSSGLSCQGIYYV